MPRGRHRPARGRRGRRAQQQLAAAAPAGDEPGAELHEPHERVGVRLHGVAVHAGARSRRPGRGPATAPTTGTGANLSAANASRPAAPNSASRSQAATLARPSTCARFAPTLKCAALGVDDEGAVARRPRSRPRARSSRACRRRWRSPCECSSRQATPSPVSHSEAESLPAIRSGVRAHRPRRGRASHRPTGRRPSSSISANGPRSQP